MSINIYLDLSKAFDTIGHTILIDKFKYYCVREINSNLFSRYLENRKQYTEIDNVQSNTSLITTGVPQGLILGPLLFITYISMILLEQLKCLTFSFTPMIQLYQVH